MGAGMNLAEAYQILQDSHAGNEDWHKAHEALAHYLMTHDGLRWARTDRRYDTLTHVYMRMIERLAEPYDGPKGEEGAGRESQKGLNGRYMWPVTEEQVLRLIGRSITNAQNTIHRKAKKTTVVSLDDDDNHYEPADTRLEQSEERYSQEFVMAALSDAHEEQGGRYVNDLRNPEHKVQKRTIHHAQTMVKGDNMLLRETATYEQVLRMHGGEPSEPKSRNTAQQRLSRARDRFLRWAREIPDTIYISEYERHISIEELVEKVVYVLTVSRKALR